MGKFTRCCGNEISATRNAMVVGNRGDIVKAEDRIANDIARDAERRIHNKVQEQKKMYQFLSCLACLCPCYSIKNKMSKEDWDNIEDKMVETVERRLSRDFHHHDHPGGFQPKPPSAPADSAPRQPRFAPAPPSAPKPPV